MNYAHQYSSSVLFRLLYVQQQYATINVVSVLGNQQNITKDIKRWDLDGMGVQRQLSYKNPDQRDILLYDQSVYESLEHLHLNGEDAVSLDKESLGYAIEEFEYVFVNFFASWCSHCQKCELCVLIDSLRVSCLSDSLITSFFHNTVHPTWEKFAEIMHDVADRTDKSEVGKTLTDEEKEAMKVDIEHPVLIGKVDCVQHEELCAREGIMAYPTLILYVNGGRALVGAF